MVMSDDEQWLVMNKKSMLTIYTLMIINAHESTPLVPNQTQAHVWSLRWSVLDIDGRKWGSTE